MPQKGFSGAAEECDEIDNNCNGEVDETGSLDVVFGCRCGWLWKSSYFVESCTQPEGYVAIHQDCDDMDSERNPDAVGSVTKWTTTATASWMRMLQMV